MKYLVKQIENEFGKMHEYLIDKKIMKGLYLTSDIKKIEMNCRNFDIETVRPNLNPPIFNNCKISVINEICVLTILVFSNSQNQFLITNDLNLEALKWLSSKNLNGYYHNVIKHAYKTMAVMNFNSLFITRKNPPN